MEDTEVEEKVYGIIEKDGPITEGSIARKWQDPPMKNAEKRKVIHQAIDALEKGERIRVDPSLLSDFFYIVF
jgi:hypothetical protein